MSEVEMKFNEKYHQVVLSCIKPLTVRRRPHGKPGDYFVLCGREFELTAVVQMPLGDVAYYLYVPDGCYSPGEFIRNWRLLYDGQYLPSQVVYAHWFRCRRCSLISLAQLMEV